MSQRYFFGRWEDSSATLTPADVTRICDDARKRQDTFSQYPIDKTLEVLQQLGNLWADPDLPERRLALEVLPELTGFSKEMVSLGLEELSKLFHPDPLRLKIKTELRDFSPYGSRLFQRGTRYHWEPLGTVLHVLSGNVFLVGAGSLVEGLLTRNITLLKMSSEEKFFTPLLLKTLQQVDRDGVISQSIAAFDYTSDQRDVIRAFKSQVDGLVVWGGEAAVQSYRSELPARVRLVLFGPKLSLSIVTESGFKRVSAKEIAKRLAFELAIWDQNACTAPQMVFVEGKPNAIELVEELAKALEQQSTEIPEGQIDMSAAAEIRKIRGLQEMAEIRGAGRLKHSSDGLRWTVYLDHDQALATCPLHRTLRVVPFQNWNEVLTQVQPFRSYVQTVGLCAGVKEQFELGASLSRAGALRVRKLGEMSGGEIDEPHDGAYDLPQLMNLFSQTVDAPDLLRSAPSELLSKAERESEINSRLRTLLRVAKKSLHYGEVLESKPVSSIQELARVPILTRELMEAGMPPQGEGLGTLRRPQGGYVTRSGGSTGKPKYSVYDGGDWENMMSEAVELFRVMGLSESDRLGNFMLSGDLYGSFVSFDQIIQRVGAMTFAFCGTSSPETIAQVWRDFGINAFCGIPAFMIPLLRKAHSLDRSLRIEKVVYAGAPLSDVDRNWLHEALGATRIASVIGANDGGQIGFQCHKQTGRLHHTVDEFNLMEIVDDNGNPAEDGSVGRILITSLLKFAYPLIRYDIGDQGRFVNEPCACGSSRRVFEYLGRHDDQISIGILNVRLRDVTKALSDLPLVETQLGVGSSPSGEFIKLKVEVDPDRVVAQERESLKRAIADRLIGSLEKYRERLQDGTLLPPQIEVLPTGSIRRNPRTGKVKAIFDERVEQ